MRTDSEDVILRLIMGPWVIFYFLCGLNVLAYRASSSYFFFFSILVLSPFFPAPFFSDYFTVTFSKRYPFS